MPDHADDADEIRQRSPNGLFTPADFAHNNEVVRRDMEHSHAARSVNQNEADQKKKNSRGDPPSAPGESGDWADNKSPPGGPRARAKKRAAEGDSAVAQDANQSGSSGTPKKQPLSLALDVSVHLIPGESAEDYELLARRVLAAIAPRDELEEILAGDVVAYTWDIDRLRRFKAKLLGMAGAQPFASAVEEFLPKATVKERAARWHNGRPRKQGKKLLVRAGLDREAVLAQGFAGAIELFERIDSRILRSVALRNSILRELDRYRESRARQ